LSNWNLAGRSFPARRAGNMSSIADAVGLKTSFHLSALKCRNLVARTSPKIDTDKLGSPITRQVDNHKTYLECNTICPFTNGRLVQTTTVRSILQNPLITDSSSEYRLEAPRNSGTAQARVPKAEYHGFTVCSPMPSAYTGECVQCWQAELLPTII